MEGLLPQIGFLPGGRRPPDGCDSSKKSGSYRLTQLTGAKQPGGAPGLSNSGMWIHMSSAMRGGAGDPPLLLDSLVQEVVHGCDE